MGRLKGFGFAAAFLVIFSQVTFGGTYGGGSGTAGDPYLISTAEQMQEIGANVGDWNKHFLLTADIDMGAYTGASYNIIGNMTDKFIGVFDGGGHNISNFTYLSSSQDYVGLFGAIGSGGLVRELGVVGVNIDTGESSYAGGIAGVSYGDITSCFVSGSVSGGLRIGGFAGGNGNGVVMSNCYCACSVGGNNEVGGFVGANDGAITNCYSIGTVAGNLDVGGFAGHNYSGTYASSFWNSETNTGLTGVGNIDDPAGVIGKTTSELKIQTSYTDNGWDFVGESANGIEDIWYMPICGYPALWWQGTGTVPDVTGLIESEAVSLIEAAGFGVEVKLVHSIDVEIGYVLSQEPEAGCEAVVELLVVTLFVSDGLPYEGGSGMAGDPYLISTAEHMQAIGANEADWNKHFLLTADIDMGAYTGDEYNIIGANWENMFEGIFDGNGHTVSNFTYGNSQYYIGLFGVVGNSGVIRELGVVDVNITAGRRLAGSIAGLNTGNILNCFATGSLDGTDFVGGIVGTNVGTTSNCYSSCRVSGVRGVGGVAGNNQGLITNCYSIGKVSGNQYVGGLSGDHYFGSYSGNFWNSDINLNLTGIGKIDDPAGVISGTTQELQTKSTFIDAGWDFIGESENGTEDIWVMPEDGYPRLSWQRRGTVPDVTGLSEAEAVSLIEAAGLEVSIVPVRSDDIQEGYVISQDPEAGYDGFVLTMTISVSIGSKPEGPHMVAADGSGVYLTIQAGIDAAVDGETVIIAEGVYKGAGNKNLRFYGKTITVRGTDPYDTGVVVGTVIDCERDGRGFIFNSNEGADSVVAGLTITNGRVTATESTPEIYGAGIVCRGASPTIEHCRIYNCEVGGALNPFFSADSYGGGIACVDRSSPSISHCTISNCTAAGVPQTFPPLGSGFGGGIACLNNSNPVISDCLITDCSAKGGDVHLYSGWACGGGIASLYNSYPVVRNSRIYRCKAEAGGNSACGGGVACYSGSSIDMSDSVIYRNIAQGGWYRSDASFASHGISSYGGGLYIVSDAGSEITNCLIVENETIIREGRDYDGLNYGNSRGGGIFCDDADVTIRNCTVGYNITYRTPAEADGYTGEGGGIYGAAVVVDSIVWGNVSGSQLADGTSASYSNVQGGWEGCIDSDPMFVPGEGGSFYLSQVASGQGATSPCVDTGSRTAVAAGMDERTTRSDKAGDSGVVDMGYHYPGVAYWAADLNRDWKIDYLDFAIMAGQWQDVPGVPSADIAPQGGDDFVGIEDLSALCAEWMRQ